MPLLSPSVSQPSSSSGRTTFVVRVLKGIAFLAALVVLIRACADADFAVALERIRNVGPLALLILVPYPIGILADATAWLWLMRKIKPGGKPGGSASLARIFHVRMSTEAVTIVLPAGGLVAEVLGPCLLAPSPEIAVSLASTSAKRWLILRSHGIFVILATLLSFGSLEQHAPIRGLPFILLASGAALIGASLLVQRGVTRTGIASRIADAIERLRRSRFLAFAFAGRAPLDRSDFEAVDNHLVEVGRSANIVPLTLLLAQWILEGVGSYIILRVLGVSGDVVSLAHVLAFDAALTVLRGAAVFAPAGLGVQDLGYMAFFHAYGVPNLDSIGPAFLVLKRSRELFFVALGFLALLFAQSRKANRPRTPTTQRPRTD
jgi:glycosyltransferase 2 family protein